MRLCLSNTDLPFRAWEISEQFLKNSVYCAEIICELKVVTLYYQIAGKEEAYLAML